MRKHIVIGISTIMGLVAHPQPGAEAPDSTALTLKAVEVSAIRASKAAISTAPLRVVDTQMMLRTGVTDVSDALHRMPGVTLRDYGGAGGLKTVSVRGFGTGHTGVVFDGVPLSDVQSGQIDLSRYSIDNVEHVSMVVGDNDDIFIPARTASAAATVGISSMPVDDSRELNAKLRLGSFGYINPFLRAGAPLSHNVALNFVGEWTHADNDYPFKLVNGTVTTDERRNNSRMNSGHAEINLSWRPSPCTSLTTKAYYYDNSRQLPGPVIYYNDVNKEHLRERNTFSQARLRATLSERLSLMVVGKFNFASSMYHDVNGKYPGGILDQRYWQREYYVSAALLGTVAPGVLIDYSADYFYNNLNSNLSTDSRPYRHSVLQSLTAKYRTQRLSVMARALWSIYLNGAKLATAAKDARRLSPSVSASYQPVAERLLYLRASYKNIFRMPTFNEAYFDHVGSLDILPESTDQVNMGATYTLRAGGWLDAATFTLDGYLNHVKDMIVAVPYNMFVWHMINLGRVRIHGLDATASLTLAPKRGHSLLLTANYSLQRAMPRTDRQSDEWGKQVAYLPKHSGSASLSYENPWVNVSVQATGVSARYTTNTNLPSTRIDGYIECGASAWRTFPMRGLNLDVRLELLNLLDKQYCIVARYPMPGRSVKVTVGVRL